MPFVALLNVIGTKLRIPWTVPISITPMCQSHSASDTSHSNELLLATPALLHKQVDSAECSDRLGSERLDLHRVADVGDHRAHLCAIVTQRTGSALEGIPSDVGEHHLHAGGSARFSETTADARRRTGHHCDSPFESPHGSDPCASEVPSSTTATPGPFACRGVDHPLLPHAPGSPICRSSAASGVHVLSTGHCGDRWGGKDPD